MADKEDKHHSDSDAQVATKPKVETKEPSFYRVIMINDDYTPMEFVIMVLETIFHHSSKESHELMLQVHQKGQATCGIFPYDVARTKVHQVKSLAKKHQHPLQCTMEKE